MKKQPRIHFADIILAEDEHLLAVNKPAGITSLALRNLPGTGLLEMARHYDPSLKLCHRLDKHTTGVLLFAKGEENYRHVAMQFEARAVAKVYRTLIAGVVQWEQLPVEAPLAPIRNGLMRVDGREGKEALTLFTTEHCYKHYTLVNCMPVTGRQHQIRVHLAHLGHPIIGDADYGGTDIKLSQFKRGYKLDRNQEEEPALHEGYLLHAYSLTLTHPHTEEFVQYLAPYPKALEAVLKILEKYDS